MKGETDIEIAARVAASLSVNDKAEGLILEGVRAGMKAVAKAKCKGCCEETFCSDCLEVQLEETRLLTVWGEKERLVAGLRKRSGDAFANKKDDEAKLLRRLMDDFDEEAKQAKQARLFFERSQKKAKTT